MGLNVFGLSVNELVVDFLVDKSGNICFGLIVLCGVGEGLVEVIVEEWEVNGKYESIFDLVWCFNLCFINKKVMEMFVMGGGFDCFEEIYWV